MAVQSFLRDTTNLFNYSTDERPTTQQEYQEAVKNWVDTIKSLVDCTLWQPDTEYTVGNVLRTPSLPYQLQLTCVTAGTTGSAEPDYTEVEAGDVITDGTAEFRVDTIVSDGDMVDETIKALASSSDVPTGTAFSAATLLSKMIANMNTEDGVRYNFSNPNAWYICFGAKYGGLIIQGGYLLINGQYTENTDVSRTITPPLTPSLAALVLPTMRGYASDRFITSANINASNNINFIIFSNDDYNLSIANAYIEYLLIDFH